MKERPTVSYPRPKAWVGVVTAVVGAAVLSAAMVPVRSHLSVATTALVLVIPVVAGVAVGGFPAGVVGVAAGFVAYDLLFIPPYGTFSVGQTQNWVALGVYVVVMLVVSRVVADLRAARAVAHRREQDARRLFEISDLLIGDKPEDKLLAAIVENVQHVFGLRGVAILLPRDGQLAVAAASGEPISPTALSRVTPQSGVLIPVSGSAELSTVPLVTTEGALGVLVLAGTPIDPHGRQLLVTFANHAALAVERAQLQERAMRTRVLEAVDQWRSALIGSVSHDLRTPLASIKASVSNLRDPTLALGRDEGSELLAMIEAESDRLTRLVTNLLDMSRIETGALEARRQPMDLSELAGAVTRRLQTLSTRPRIRVEIPPDLPAADGDPVLMGQVLTNLLENAVRHTGGGDIVVRAEDRGDHIEVSVADHGPGIPAGQRDDVFLPFHRLGQPGPHVPGIGLGLAIAKAFVEAQGGSIRVEDNRGGGALVRVSLPVFPLPTPVG